MNIHEYIESGNLELYAMGALPPDEAAEVARAVAAYPELREELEKISRTLEEIAPVEGLDPRSGLREEILAALPPQEASMTEPSVIPYRPERPSGRSYLLAASFIGLLISVGAAVWFWSRWMETEEELTESIRIQEQLASAIHQAEQELQTLRNYDNRVVRMTSTGEEAEAFAVLFWNPQTQTVWIDASKMPPLPKGKQYQLWAIAGGDPVDAGVFDGRTEHLQELKRVTEAHTFAVTVEPRGGSETPTLETMTVSGQL